MPGTKLIGGVLELLRKALDSVMATRRKGF
jgi:hypothetical protein